MIRPDITPRDRAEAVRAALRGEKMEVVAARYRVARRTVQNWIAAAGKQRRPGAPSKVRTHASWARMLARGMSAAQIAKAYCVTPAAVRIAMKRLRGREAARP